MKYSFSLLIIVFAYTACFAQKKSDRLKKVVDDMANHGGYMTATIGYGAKFITGQWARFEQFKKLVNRKKLIEFTDHPSPAIRCYAFKALSERGYRQTFAVLIKHLKDNDTIPTVQGCVPQDMLVSEFFLENTSYAYKKKGQYNFRKKEREIIDSLLFFAPNKSKKLTAMLLRVIQPKEQYYTKIRQTYLKDKDLGALLAMARYRKKEDRKFILEQLNLEDNDFYTDILLRIIKSYPDATFLPYLKEVLKQNTSEPSLSNELFLLYAALVQYQNLESKKLIIKTLKNVPKDVMEDHHGYLWLALTQYPHPIYKDIKKSIKLDKWTKRDLINELEYMFLVPEIK